MNWFNDTSVAAKSAAFFTDGKFQGIGVLRC
jgi:hypothetical protein